jgi:type IV secretion system protein VirB3
MKKNVLFRGCTRPAMFLGVPYIPFFIGAGSGLMMGMYFNFFWLLSIPVIIFVMRQMARRDEMIFTLLALRWQFKFKARNVQHHSGMWVFTPNNYRTKSDDNK